MSNLRDSLAAAQEREAPEPKATLVNDDLPYAGNLLHEARETTKKTLSEVSLLKAKVHQLTMINQMLQDDNYKLNRDKRGAQLKEQQRALELEFATETDCAATFDWNTLSFGVK